jgi:hypothetical protein
LLAKRILFLFSVIGFCSTVAANAVRVVQRLPHIELRDRLWKGATVSVFTGERYYITHSRLPSVASSFLPAACWLYLGPDFADFTAYSFACEIEILNTGSVPVHTIDVSVEGLAGPSKKSDSSVQWLGEYLVHCVSSLCLTS